MDGGYLVDKRKSAAEGVDRRPGRFREVARVLEGVNVVQELNSARERHLDNILPNDRCASNLLGGTATTGHRGLCAGEGALRQRSAISVRVRPL